MFPKTYEACASHLTEDAKIFVEGRVSVEEDRDAKLIASKIYSFDDVPKIVWIRFKNMESYESGIPALDNIIADSDGFDEISIYLDETRQVKKLGRGQTIRADKNTLEMLREKFGKENVRIS